LIHRLSNPSTTRNSYRTSGVTVSIDVLRQHLGEGTNELARFVELEWWTREISDLAAP
jgi:hypothetical protein